MKKIIFIFVVLIIASVGISSNLYFYNRNIEKKLSIKNDPTEKIVEEKTEDKEEKINVPISEDIQNNDNDNKNTSNDDDNISKSNMESNSSSDSNVINNKEDIIQEKKEKHETVKETIPEPQPVLKQEQQKEPMPWDSLGISEYDYYNKPMWSWARVDYSVKTYGTLEQTHQACIDDGNKLEDIISFSCDNINSYSGDYLGDMLRVKK